MMSPHGTPVVAPVAGTVVHRGNRIGGLSFHLDGVDIGLLIDAAARFGVESLAQVDLGVRVHRNRPLAELGPMATIVMMTALRRAGALGVPGEVALEQPRRRVVAVEYLELPPLATIDGDQPLGQ